MELIVDFPDRKVTRFVHTVFSDQVPFAQSFAVRQTGLDFQKAQRQRLTQIFEQRRPRWQARSVKVTEWPTKQKPEMRIAIESPGGRSDILGKFETETSKSPFRGRSVAVPTEHVPRTGAGVIRKGWRPRELFENPQQHGRGPVIATKGNVYRGTKGSFIVRRPGGRGTIFRRERSGAVVVLYQLVPRVRIDPELEFIDTAKRVVNERWEPNFLDAFDFAIRTAR